MLTCALWRMISAERYERSEEHTSELQSRFGISYAVFCLKKKTEDRKGFCAVPSVTSIPEHHGGCPYSSNLRPPILFFFLMIRGPPKSPLFPYTPLFRSLHPRSWPDASSGRETARAPVPP